MITFNKFTISDKKAIIKLVCELQDFLVEIDPLKRLRRLPKYGEKYIEDLLEKIEKHQGIIFIAKDEKISAGFIAGIIQEQKPDNLLECVPTKPARILELIVSEKFRGKNIGSQLMKKAQQYFQQKGCDVIRVEVFEPNVGAHKFYQKLGFKDRVTDMIKKIK